CAPTQALRQPITALLLIVILAGGFEVLRRRTAREFPDGTVRLGAQLRTAVARADAARRGTNGHGRSAAAPAPAAPGDQVERLERVAELHERGVLTDEEFGDAKREILAGAGAGAGPGPAPA